MKLWGKIAIGVVGLVVLVVAGLFIFTKFYFTPDKLKEIVEPLVKEEVKRDVTLGKLQFDLFSGLKMDGFAIKERPPYGNGNFVSCDSLVFEYDLLPLLIGKLAIGRVALIKPSVEIIRDKNGKFNFDDLTAGRGKADESESSESGGGLIDLSISSMVIKDGRAVYKDLKSGQSLIIEELNIKAKDIAPHKPVSLDLSLVFNGVPIKAVGRVSPDSKTGSGKLTTGRIDLSKINKLLPADSPLKLQSGMIQADVDSEFTGLGQIKAKGYLSGTGLTFQVPAQGLNYKDLNVRADFDAKIYPERGMLSLASSKLTVGQTSLTASGRAAKQGFDMVIELPEQDLAPLKKLLPPKVELPIESGKAALKVRVTSTDPGQQITFDLKGQTVKLALAAQAGAPVKPLDLSLTALGYALPQKGQAFFKNLELTAPGVELIGAGMVGRSNLDFDLKKLVLDLAKASAQGPFLGPYQAQGLVNANLKIKGNPNKPEKMDLDGQAQLKGVQVSGGRLPAELKLAGLMVIKDQDLKDLKMTGSLGESNFTMTGSGKHLAVKPDVVFNLTVDKADVAKLTPKGGPADKQQPKEATKDKKAKDEEPEGMNIPLTAKGRITVGELTYKLAKLKNVLVDYTLKDNVLTLGRIGSKVWPVGDLTANMRLDLGKKGYGYKGLISLAKAEMAPLAGSFTGPEIGQFSGLGWLEGSFDGAGVRFPDLWKNLTAKFKTNMTGGRIKANPQLTQVADHLGIPQLKDFRFDSMKGDFTINKGLMNLDSTVVSKIIPAKFKGTLGLAGQDSNLMADMKIPPKLISNPLAEKMIGLLPKDDKGLTVVPLKLTGQLDDLKIAFNEEALAALAAEGLKRKAGNVFKGVTGSKDSGKVGDSVGEAATGLIKGLTGGSKTDDKKTESATQQKSKASTDSSGTKSEGLGDVIKKSPLNKLFN